MLNMNKEEIKKEQKKGLIARILGGLCLVVFYVLTLRLR